MSGNSSLSNISGGRVAKIRNHSEWGNQIEGNDYSHVGINDSDDKQKMRKRSLRVFIIELFFRRLMLLNKAQKMFLSLILMIPVAIFLSSTFKKDIPVNLASLRSSAKILGTVKEAPYKNVYSLPYPQHMYEVHHMIHVFIPLYNAEAFVVEAVESVLKQSYPKKKVWVYNDGSTDLTSALLHSKFSTDPRVVLLKNKTNLGPAQNKWLGLQTIYKDALPDDIVVILDGDDFLLTDTSLAVIHREHLEKKAWFTYGSYMGPFSNELNGLDEDTHLDFRNNRWRYGHPRSFKAFLIGYLFDEDFKHSDGTWLTKGTDRGFIYRFLELAGPERISFITTPIYFYRKHQNNTWSLISKESKEAQLKHMNSLPRSPVLEEDIHVFMVTWGRIHILHDTVFSLLHEQTVSDRVKLHIWNNNPEIKSQVDAIVSIFSEDKVDVIHSKINLYSFARFLHIKKVMSKTFVDYVVIVDDDQLFSPDYVERLWADKRPLTFTSWWGRQFHGMQYFKGSPDYRELAQGLKLEIMDFDYAGPGGCVIDANAFHLPATLAIPQKFDTLDDLWLSYVMHMAGWYVQRTLVRPRTITDTKTAAVALWTQLKNDKDEFLNYLRQGGWNV